ncbi:IS30 family transposase [Bifidobacterium longum subsp. longum]|uniref:IS30 family transposase n=1 Tax=Bifidobacterium longum subsp. longum TaxID=1679 RepID=A0A4R0UXF2_BIFLL|nr:IS30 family transposase [Bifidobacterium longum subsp. longum]
MGEVYSHLSEEERRVIRIEIGNGTIICGIVLMLGRCVLSSWSRPFRRFF